MDSVDKPSSARVYDYLLGGVHNYAIDREFGDRLRSAYPDTPRVFRSNREFVGRVVRHALSRGITQFLDVGAGLPSMGQAHEVADACARAEGREPDARVVYVDYEPIAHAHAEILLAESADPERHQAVVADFNDPKTLWTAALDTGLIHPDEPTCVLFTALLHFQPDDKRPVDTMAYYRERLAPGSLVALTHATATERTDEAGTFRQYDRATEGVTTRDPDQIAEFLGDWTVLDPGIVWLVDWRPDGRERQWWDDDPSRTSALAVVAEKSDATPRN